MEAIEQEEIGLAELVQLCAVNHPLYERTFFPKTVRQKSPPFHADMDAALFGTDRLVAMEIFRGGAKTTKLRLYISKVIAYGLAHTIMVVGKSQDPAKRTIGWIMTQIEYNTTWAQTFGLRKGKKWSEEEIEIYHGTEEHPIRIIALGITGSTRGINVDDYRPDLIVVDDPSDEENTLTQEQREKTDDFINGSLRNSLAPVSEAPHAKMVFLQTLLHENDSIARCEKDPLWKFLRFSVFDERGESRWPDRWSTEWLLKEKESFTARGKLHLWMREMECTITDDTLSAFRRKSLKFWDILPPANESVFYAAIDPVPPPSERELERGLKGKDYEVHAVIQKHMGNLYLVKYDMSHGHDPEWSIITFFQNKESFNPRKCRVESVAYQRTLKVLIEKAMSARGQWMQITDGTRNGKADRRKKSYRIVDAIGSAASQGKLYVHPSHTEFIQQFNAYPAIDFDDVIEAVSMAIDEAINDGGILEGEFSVLENLDGDYEELEFGGCP